MSHFISMNFKSIAALVLMLGAQVALAQDPDPRAILEGARLSATLTKLDEGLTGNLSQGKKKVPVTLFLKGENIQFQFSEDQKNWRIFHMRVGDVKFQLFEIVNGKTQDFDEAKLVSPIAGSDLTYEDLAMRFFYWPNPKYMGQEDVGGQPCYKIQVQKPAGVAGRYEVVHIWVHVKYGAFMRIRGHNKDGKLVKEFQVEDVMKVDENTWTLRKMQVATYDPKTERRQSITDLVFDTPKKSKPKGLR